jgi:hypothetical protein
MGTRKGVLAWFAAVMRTAEEACLVPVAVEDALADHLDMGLWPEGQPSTYEGQAAALVNALRSELDLKVIPTSDFNEYNGKLTGNLDEALSALGVDKADVCVLADHHLLSISQRQTLFDQSRMQGVAVCHVCPCCLGRHWNPAFYQQVGPFRYLPLSAQLEGVMEPEEVLDGILRSHAFNH